MLKRPLRWPPQSASCSKGFTLIELLVVVAIIGILSTICVYTLGQIKEKAYVTVMNHDLKNFFNAQQDYFTEKSTFKGRTGDVFSNNPDIPSTVHMYNFTLSKNVSITISSEDPFTAVAKYMGSQHLFECNIETGHITERL